MRSCPCQGATAARESRGSHAAASTGLAPHPMLRRDARQQSRVVDRLRSGNPPAMQSPVSCCWRSRASLEDCSARIRTSVVRIAPPYRRRVGGGCAWPGTAHRSRSSVRTEIWRNILSTSVARTCLCSRRRSSTSARGGSRFGPTRRRRLSDYYERGNTPALSSISDKLFDTNEII